MATTTNYNFNLIDFDKIPWHEDDHNNWHEVDALLARYLSISNVKGVWQAATTVAVGERYIDSADDTIWEVLVAHTTSSTLSFSAERAAQSTYWQSISVDASYAGDWAAGKSYTVNEFVTDNKRYGVVTTAHTSVTSYNQGVSDGNITTLIDASTLVSSSPVANTLGVGESATVAYNSSTGVFTFGLPTGATGATGSGIDVLTTRGDVAVQGASAVARLAVGSANTVLKSDGTDPSWSSIATAMIDNNAIDETKIKDAFVGDFTEVTIAAGDSILLGDVNDSGNTKRDTVQGILDLVSIAGRTVSSWCVFDGSGTFSTTPADSLNVSGVVDNGTGDYDVTWNTDFDSATEYTAVHGALTTGGFYLAAWSQDLNTTDVQVLTGKVSDGSLVDSDIVSTHAIGDLA
jgi:hypothetical protein